MYVNNKSNVILSELNYKDIMYKEFGGNSLLLGDILAGEEDTIDVSKLKLLLDSAVSVSKEAMKARSIR